jgi:hypothetical protein
MDFGFRARFGEDAFGASAAMPSILGRPGRRAAREAGTSNNSEIPTSNAREIATTLSIVRFRSPSSTAR